MSASVEPVPAVARAPQVAKRDAEHAANLRAASLFLTGSGGYSGASSKKRSLREWWPAAKSADQDTVPDLKALRSRSRDLERNSPIAGGAIETVTTSVIGDEIRLSSRLNREVLGITEEAATDWEAKAERIYRVASRQLDVTNRQAGGQLQDLALTSQLVSGDMLVIRRFFKRPGDLLGLKIQCVEADRVSTPNDRVGDPLVVDGVERDLNGASMAHHVRNRHPDDLLRGEADSWVRIPSRGTRSQSLMSFLLMDRKRVDQARGVPYLAGVIEPLKQLERYSDSELAAAVVSSFFTVFVKSATGGGLANQTDAPLPPDDGTTDSKARDLKLAPAAIFDLQPGEEIQTADPNRPNSSFDPFVESIITQIGMRLGIPYEVLAKRFTASYSASRASILEAWRFFKRRRAWFALNFCDPLYEWIITEAILSGLLDAPGYFDDPIVHRAWLGAVWTGPAQGSIDPKKEYEAYEILEQNTWASDSDITQETRGQDFEDVAIRAARDRDTRVRHGLKRRTAPAATAPDVSDPTPNPDLPESEDES